MAYKKPLTFDKKPATKYDNHRSSGSMHRRFKSRKLYEQVFNDWLENGYSQDEKEKDLQIEAGVFCFSERFIHPDDIGRFMSIPGNVIKRKYGIIVESAQILSKYKITDEMFKLSEKGNMNATKHLLLNYLEHFDSSGPRNQSQGKSDELPKITITIPDGIDTKEEPMEDHQ